jgi:hypothetical protein
VLAFDCRADRPLRRWSYAVKSPLQSRRSPRRAPAPPGRDEPSGDLGAISVSCPTFNSIREALKSACDNVFARLTSRPLTTPFHGAVKA